jgi:hypothetical protein
MTTNQITDRGLNLGTHRQNSSVWQRRGWDGTRQRLAMSRLLVGIGGGALALQAMRSKTLSGRMLAGLGGTLAWWALTGEGDLTEARRWFDRVIERAPWKRAADPVQLASDESFPASDPPAWTPTVSTAPKRRTPPTH